MLATSFFYPQSSYTPPRSSPLSERPANVLPRAFLITMAAQPQPDKKPVPQRAYKPNPVMQSRDAVTQRRRDMFFRRVQKDRDDRKWDARGEQIQRLDFISSHKRWEAEKARQAPELAQDCPDEEIWGEATKPELDMDEADSIFAQEEDELRQLVASLEEDQGLHDTASQHYGSDDEDYDQIFIECTAASDTKQLEHMNASFDDADAMDTTDG